MFRVKKYWTRLKCKRVYRWMALTLAVSHCQGYFYASTDGKEKEERSQQAGGRSREKVEGDYYAHFYDPDCNGKCIRILGLVRCSWYSPRGLHSETQFSFILSKQMYFPYTNLFSTQIHLSFRVHKQAFWPILPVLPAFAAGENWRKIGAWGCTEAAAVWC